MVLPAWLLRDGARVRLLGLDVDGVLTTGALFYGPEGEALKAFHVRDGLGLRLLAREGIEVVVVSGRRSRAVERRMAELGVAHVHLGCDDKGARMERILDELGLTREDAAFVGDDLPDLAAMREVAMPIAVHDAHPRVQTAARWVTEADGGRGAVREIAEALLECRGRLEEALAPYTRPRREGAGSAG